MVSPQIVRIFGLNGELPKHGDWRGPTLEHHSRKATELSESGRESDIGETVQRELRIKRGALYEGGQRP